jgi:hypothetical protein
MLNKYVPDYWIVFKILSDTNEVLYKVLAGWSGGYLYGNSWRINSGIVGVEEDEDFFHFKGSSGSVYSCMKDRYDLRGETVFVWAKIKDRYEDLVEEMPEDTDWGRLIDGS